MNRNYLSLQDHDISRIGFGCWQLAGDYQLNGKPNGYGHIDQHEAVKAIHLALDNGINFFDTAIGYGSGKSEILLGEALLSYTGNGNRKPFICTKYGMILDQPGNDDDDFSAKNFIASVEGSLKRLQVDTLGVMLLHNPPDDFDFSTLDTAPFEKMINDGKILSYGVSCRTQKGVANVLSHNFGSVIEAVYNVLDRRYEKFFSDPLYSKYTFICRVPLASGFISPRILSADIKFPANDIRNNFNREQVEWVTNSVKKLAFLNELVGGISVSALRFQLSNHFNTITIPGIKNTKQADDAIMAMRLGPLPDNIIDDIATAVPDVFYKWK